MLGTPLYGYVGVCGPKGCGFSAVLVINSGSILAALVINREWFSNSGLELAFFLEEAPFSSFIDKSVQQKSFTMPLTSV